MNHPTTTHVPTGRRRALTLLSALGLLLSGLVALSAGTSTAGAAPTAPRAAEQTAQQTSQKTARARSHWPGRHNTGVPEGTRLRPYRGPCTITSTRTISRVDATKRCDAILIRAPRVLITKSLLPRVDATAGGSASVRLVDVRVKGGHWSDGAIWGYNIRAKRVNATGGQHTFHCADRCRVVDSWLHKQWNPRGQSFHNNAFISNGGSRMVIRHNRLHCTPRLNSTDGGCTADLSLFGDFDPIRRVTIDHNLFMPNLSSISYCLYAGWNPGKPYGDNPTNIKVTDNVFRYGTKPNGRRGRCGVYGPVTSYKASGEGNVWRGNRWAGGGRVRPSGA
jgi:hypothetical protein